MCITWKTSILKDELVDLTKYGYLQIQSYLSEQKFDTENLLHQPLPHLHGDLSRQFTYRRWPICHWLAEVSVVLGEHMSHRSVHGMRNCVLHQQGSRWFDKESKGCSKHLKRCHERMLVWTM